MNHQDYFACFGQSFFALDARRWKKKKKKKKKKKVCEDCKDYSRGSQGESKPSPFSRFLRGAGEQGIAMNMLEDWGREW